MTATVTSDTVRVDHPDGAITLVVRHAEWDAIVTLTPEFVKRARDKRLRVYA